MQNKTEALIDILAAVFVMFSAMLDPKISVVIAIIALIGLSAHNLLKKK